MFVFLNLLLILLSTINAVSPKIATIAIKFRLAQPVQQATMEMGLINAKNAVIKLIIVFNVGILRPALNVKRVTKLKKGYVRR